ncbi:MAG: zf-HC2 domain-containing protein [Nitriliruptorales bacterium]|nr:zf-HC2 domain-containing protein [Nitriliruptorales bacterium]
MTDPTDHGSEDRHVKTELGAYVLGGLEPAERRAVDAHIEHCASCRDELSRLSALPPLLDRLTVEEATADYTEVRQGLAATVAEASELERRRLHRQLRVWRTVAAVAAAIALIVGLVAWQPWEDPPDRLVVQVVPVTELAGGVDGTVAAYAWEWGTTVELRVSDLPPAASYEIWAVSEDGRRERAGTWGPTEHRGALVRGASAIQRHDLARVEITDEGGAALFAAEFREG